MRKKLFAILMSAMMMVTFMPAMAFAGTTLTESDVVVTFTADHLTATAVVKKDTSKTMYFDTVREFNESTGAIDVTVKNTDNEIKTAVDTYFTGDDATFIAGEIASAADFYYDLTNAKVCFTNNAVIPGSLPKTTFEGLFGTSGTFSGLKLVAPTGLGAGSAFVAKNAFAGKSALGTKVNNAWTATLVKPTNYDKNSDVEQPLTLTVEFGLSSGATDAALSTVEKNAIAQAIKVQGTTYTFANELFFLDTVKTTGGETAASIGNLTNGYVYDGAEHKLVAKKIAGVNVAFDKLNAKSGAWEPVAAVSFKNVADSATYRVTVTDANSKTTDTTTFAQNSFVVNVTKPLVYIGLRKIDKGLVIYEGDTYDAYDFVELYYNNDVNAKVVKNDEAAIREFVKTFYEVKATPRRYDANTIDLTLALKEGVATTDKAYTDAELNWNVALGKTTTAVLTITEAAKTNEIDFLGNASYTKTVHVKSAKAVKKATTRTVQAEALSGTAVTFKKITGNSKITVAADGTMTIKKGLKKGTYKVVVKATAAAGNGYKRITAKETYTVKVVK